MTATSIPTKTSKADKAKRINKAAKVRAMLAKGKTPTEIAKALKILPQYVYTVRSYERKKEELSKGTVIKRGPGRPRKHPFANPMPPVQATQPEFGRAPTLWERIKAMLGFN